MTVLRFLVSGDAVELHPTSHGVTGDRHFVAIGEFAVHGTWGELMDFADRFSEAVLELYKFDAAEPSPSRLVSPVSAAGSPASSAPGLVATTADGGTGGAPGTPADCVPVPAPNPNNPKEGE